MKAIGFLAQSCFHELGVGGRWREGRECEKTLGWERLGWPGTEILVSGVSTYTEIKGIRRLVQKT